MTYAGTSVTSPGRLFHAEILIGGVALPTFTGPDGYRWVAGVPGQQYEVRVISTAGRIEVVLGIDGRDALEDEAADLLASRGMVISSAYPFKGFRVDDKTTRAFTFGSVAGSVADQAQALGSVGTIGIAAYREQPAEPVYRSLTRSAGSRGIGEPVVLAAASMGPDLGTHAGDALFDPVGRTTFERSGSPDVLEIGYRSIAALEAMGIATYVPSGSAHASAFPGRTTGYERYEA
jgi:hypothetical protein